MPRPGRKQQDPRVQASVHTWPRPSPAWPCSEPGVFLPTASRVCTRAPLASGAVCTHPWWSTQEWTQALRKLLCPSSSLSNQEQACSFGSPEHIGRWAALPGTPHHCHPKPGRHHTQRTPSFQPPHFNLFPFSLASTKAAVLHSVFSRERQCYLGPCSEPPVTHMTQNETCFPARGSVLFLEGFPSLLSVTADTGGLGFPSEPPRHLSSVVRVVHTHLLIRP